MAPAARASALPSRDPVAAPTLRDAAKVAAWGLLFWGAVQYAGIPLGRSAIALVAVQALLAEWCAGRIDIPWSDPLAPLPGARAIAGRAAAGAAAGGVAAVLVLLLLRTWMRVDATAGSGTPGDSPTLALEPTGLALAVVVSLLQAARDELLLRGVMLRATRGLVPWWASLLAVGAAAAGAQYGMQGVVGLGLAAEALRGVALGALWLRDRGAWMAVAANASWTFALGLGGVVDLHVVAGGDASGAALLVTALAAIAGVSSLAVSAAATRRQV